MPHQRSRTWTSLTPRRGTWALALAVAGALAAPSPALAAPDADPTLVSLPGTLVQIVVDAPHDVEGDAHAGDGASLVLETAVRVDGAVIDLPDSLGELPGPTGTPVVVQVALDAPAPTAEVVADLVSATPEAEVVAVRATGELPAQAPAATDAVSTRALTVLPVYWTDNNDGANLAPVASTAAAYWAAQSQGQVQLQPDVRAWKKIPGPDAGTCSTSTIMSQALAANGLSGSTASRHVVVYFPRFTPCGWAGLATVGGGASGVNDVWINGSLAQDVLAHELGHNLGLGHASTAVCPKTTPRVPLLLPISSCGVNEYGDYADVMGIGMAYATGTLTSASADYLGWATVARPAAGVTSRYTLAPLSALTGLRGIAIPVSGGTVYIDYRPAVAPDTRQPAWAGVQIHLQAPEPGWGYYPRTYLLDMGAATGSAFARPALPVGTTWTVPGTDLAVTVNAVGATADITVSPSPTSLAGYQGYVTAVYQDLFHRSPDPGGLASWTQALMAGTPRAAVANSITSSTEYRTSLIQGVYRTYLGRDADAGGLAYWLGQMAAGRTVQDIEGGFLASDELYQRAGGTPQAWVTALYSLVLHRNPAPSEVAYWVGTGRNRGAIAMGFLLSTEHLLSVVDGYYQSLLGRPIDSAGGLWWAQAIQRGSRVEQIIAGIVSSDEYVLRSLPD